MPILLLPCQNIWPKSIKKIWTFLGLQKRGFGNFKQFLRNFDLNQKADLPWRKKKDFIF
jgi:hypothetical protein